MATKTKKIGETILSEKVNQQNDISYFSESLGVEMALT